MTTDDRDLSSLIAIAHERVVRALHEPEVTGPAGDLDDVPAQQVVERVPCALDSRPPA